MAKRFFSSVQGHVACKELGFKGAMSVYNSNSTKKVVVEDYEYEFEDMPVVCTLFW
jgi:hypothetical protein